LDRVETGSKKKQKGRLKWKDLKGRMGRGGSWGGKEAARSANLHERLGTTKKGTVLPGGTNHPAGLVRQKELKKNRLLRK